jgi:hypothetical protein
VDPTRLIGHLADGKIRGAENFRRRRKSDVDPYVLHSRIARENSAPHIRGSSSPASRGKAMNRMAVRKLIGITRTKLIRVERPPSFVLV